MSARDRYRNNRAGPGIVDDQHAAQFLDATLDAGESVTDRTLSADAGTVIPNPKA